MTTNPVVLARIDAARRFVHATVCVPTMRSSGEYPCVACPTASGTLSALVELDAKPRDARAARLALHDVVCRSERCAAEDTDHADRTQAKTAAALRKFRAQE